MKTVIKKSISLLKLYRAARYINRKKPPILMYHGLTDDRRIRDWTQVYVNDFEDQIKFLSQYYNPIPLAELAEDLSSGNMRPYSAAVTFDDGYLSNLTLALPILKKYNVPATVFVASGFIRGYKKGCGLLWPDFITALLRSIDAEQIDLSEFGLNKYDFTTDMDFDCARRALAERLKSAEAADRENFLDQLDKRFGQQIIFDNFPEYHPLSLVELKNLANDPLISIGGHSINHPILSKLGEDDMTREIVECRNELEKMTETEVAEFAYPNGRIEDIGSKVLEMTSYTYICAVTTESGLNHKGQNKFLLRRFGIGRHLNLDQFKALISGIYHIGQKPIQELI